MTIFKHGIGCNGMYVLKPHKGGAYNFECWGCGHGVSVMDSESLSLEDLTIFRELVKDDK